MKPWTSWLAQVGLAGSCLTWVGCGGNNAPEADSDAPPVTSAAPAASTPEDSAAPAEATTAAETAPAATPAGDSETATAATEEAPAARPEPASATNEMLALANGTAASGSSSSTDKVAGNAAPGSSNASSAMPTSGMPGPGSSSAAGPAMSGAPDGAPSSGMAGDVAVALSPDIASNINETPIEGVSGKSGSLNPTVFKSPFTAANAFLAALQRKNPDWLAQATALRASTEASPKYQKVFTAILEQSLAPEDLDELAKKFEGMKIMGNNTPKSTGRFEVIVGKGATNGSQFHRTITLRKEKLGWKVVDISGVREFEKPIVMPTMRGGSMGGHHR